MCTPPRMQKVATASTTPLSPFQQLMPMMRACPVAPPPLMDAQLPSRQPPRASPKQMHLAGALMHVEAARVTTNPGLPKGSHLSRIGPSGAGTAVKERATTLGLGAALARATIPTAREDTTCGAQAGKVAAADVAKVAKEGFAKAESIRLHGAGVVQLCAKAVPVGAGTMVPGARAMATARERVPVDIGVINLLLGALRGQLHHVVVEEARLRWTSLQAALVLLGTEARGMEAAAGRDLAVRQVEASGMQLQAAGL
mmetsp:Transcript_66218/g.158389  ORF Transcript_66218/g.158389 Transcript_66218/m.158389 type:complete len:256 (+) Transcript_66218:463-1230(+)